MPTNGWGNIYCNSFSGDTALGTGGFTGLLDEYPDAAFAASVRLLDSTYTDGLLRVRAFDGASDQGTADVLPDPNENYFISLNSTITNLDATATGRGLTTSDTLGDLLSSGVNDYDGFVTTFFDQSGNSNDAEHNTASSQYQIASSGSLNVDNSKPAANGEGKTGYFLSSKIIDIKTAIAVGRKINDETINYVFGSGTIPRTGGYVGAALDNYLGVFTSNVTLNNSSAQIADNTQFLAIFDYSTQWNCAVNGGSFSSTGDSGQIDVDRAFGRNLDFLTLSGNSQELIIYDESKSANKSGIETNINNAFSIYP